MRYDLMLSESDSGKVCKSVSAPRSEKSDNHVEPSVRDKDYRADKAEQRERDIKDHSARENTV